MKVRVSWTLPADLTAEASAFAAGDYVLVQKSGAEEVSKIDASFIRTTAHFTTFNPAALGAAEKGTSDLMSRGDHVHPTTGLMTTSHLANSISGWDTVPVALGASASAGNATSISRSNHVHPKPSPADIGAMATSHLANSISGWDTVPVALGASAAAGDATSISRSNHVHPRPTPADIGAMATSHTANSITALGGTSQALAASASNGSGTAVALSNHVHPRPTPADIGAMATTHLANTISGWDTAPEALGASASAGNATSISRSNHVHPKPSPADIGAMATSHTANSITALGGTSQALAASASNGSGTAVALSNHVHPEPTPYQITAARRAGDGTQDFAVATLYYTALSASSDRRRKKDIIDSDLGLDFITKLRPVRYRMIVGKHAPDQENNLTIPVPGVRPHYGFIAQEVKAALGERDFAGYEDQNQTGENLYLRYHEYIAPIA